MQFLIRRDGKPSARPHWRQRTAAEREEFVKLFRDSGKSLFGEDVFYAAAKHVRFGREVIDNEFARLNQTMIQVKARRSPWL